MKKRIFAIIACVVVLISTFTVCISAADTEYISVPSYNGELLYISYDPSKGEKITWNPNELEYLALEAIYEPDDSDPSYLYEFRVRNVPTTGAVFELKVHTSLSGVVLDGIARVYQFELYYNETAMDNGDIVLPDDGETTTPEGGEITTPEGGSTITPDIDEIIDGVGHVYMKYFIGDLPMIQLFGGEVMKTLYGDIPALQKDSQFWFDEDEDGINDYQCLFFRVIDAFEDTVTYDIEIEKYDATVDSYEVCRVYHITLGRYPQGDNTWRDQYNELVERYTEDNVTDWYGLVSYLLQQNRASLTQGEQNGYKNGYAKGYKIGFDDGYVDGSDGEITFFGFLKTVMLTPVTMLKEVTNFDIAMPGGGNFNIWSIITVCITVVLAIFVISKLRGK